MPGLRLVGLCVRQLHLSLEQTKPMQAKTPLLHFSWRNFLNPFLSGLGEAIATLLAHQSLCTEVGAQNSVG